MKARREKDNQWASASRAVPFSPPCLGGLAVLWCCQIKGCCASVSITALRSHLPLPGIRISLLWDTVSAKLWEHKGGQSLRGGTGAFLKAAQRGLLGFAVIYLFKIGNKFSQVADMHSFTASLAPAVNSCSINNGGCEQDCVQLSEDHYKCQCQPGYQLKTDGKSCEGESCATCLNTHSTGNLKDPRMGFWVTLFIPISPCLPKAALGIAY